MMSRMIVCHERKFIFLKTSKTAGTSAEIALSKYCGPRDIITTIWHKDEQTRRERGHRGAQNYAAPPWDYRPRDVAKLILKRFLKRRFYNHMPAREVMQHVDPDVWNSYFKFCIVRNPWDRVISAYYWYCRPGKKILTLEQFLDSYHMEELNQKGVAVYTIDDEIVVDQVCRYESLEDDLEEVRKKIGLPDRLELPNAKAGLRKDRRHYSEVFDDSQKEKLGQVFQQEIELMRWVY